MSGPQYLSRGGEQVFVPSYVAEGVQFFGFVVKADSAPSERCVQSLADSAKYRLPANGSGFENLVITGDWIRTATTPVASKPQSGLVFRQRIRYWVGHSTRA
jgi:hypothetical protein